jgi:hypothetical protein
VLLNAACLLLAAAAPLALLLLPPLPPLLLLPGAKSPCGTFALAITTLYTSCIR